MGIKNIVSTSIKGLIISLGSVIVMTAPVFASVSGNVYCFVGNPLDVMGIWVEVPSGTSGWAARGDNGNGGDWYSYGAVSAGTTYKLHVGCGGTPSNWQYNIKTPWLTGGYYNFACTLQYGCASI